ncbi:MAG: PGPGW domain-containing protein [Patescibacteria group bacterium]
MNLLKIVKEYIHDRPKIKKTIGIILILIGLAALLTPLTPGSWLLFIGLELLGLRVLLSDKLLKFFKRK